MVSTKLRKYGILPGIVFVIAVTVCRGDAAGVAQPPERVVIDTLAARYEPVYFDHALHDSYASCVECHHHVTGEPPSDPFCLPCHSDARQQEAVGCASCHLADRYAPDLSSPGGEESFFHNDVPGLIGAYHLNCISCHRVIGTGPVGCESCHAVKK